MRLDIGMRHGPIYRNVEDHACQDSGGPVEARDITRPRCHQARLGSVGAPEPKIHQQLAWGGENAASCLGGDQRLKVDKIQQSALHELRLSDGGRDTQDGLIGKEHGSFRHRVHVSREAPLCETIDQ